MSKNSRKVAEQPVAEEIAGVEEIAIRAVEINRTLKVAGEHHRAGTIFTDLSSEQADEIVSAGYGRYVDVGVPVDAFVDDGGNPVDGDTPSEGGEGEGEDSTETAETA